MKRYTLLLIGVLLALLLALVGGAAAQAESTALDPILVDAEGNDAVTAMAPDGSFVVVWHDSLTAAPILARALQQRRRAARPGFPRQWRPADR